MKQEPPGGSHERPERTPGLQAGEDVRLDGRYARRRKLPIHPPHARSLAAMARAEHPDPPPPERRPPPLAPRARTQAHALAEDQVADNSRHGVKPRGAQKVLHATPHPPRPRRLRSTVPPARAGPGSPEARRDLQAMPAPHRLASSPRRQGPAHVGTLLSPPSRVARSADHQRIRSIRRTLSAPRARRSASGSSRASSASSLCISSVARRSR